MYNQNLQILEKQKLDENENESAEGEDSYLENLNEKDFLQKFLISHGSELGDKSLSYSL